MMVDADTYSPAEVVWALQLYSFNVSPDAEGTPTVARPPPVLHRRMVRAHGTTDHRLGGVSDMDCNTLTRYVDQALESYGREAKETFALVAP